MRASDLEAAAATIARLRSGDARAARQAAGVSGAEVAVILGVSRMAVWDWESGRKTPTAAHALAYGALLGRLAKAA